MSWDLLIILTVFGGSHWMSVSSYRSFKPDADDKAASALFALLPITNGFLAAILVTLLIQGGTLVPFWH